MGRPRSFKDDDVLDRALQAFWTAGFEATTIEDLEAATGLKRASLYGAFGDKDALFRACLARYARHIARPWLDDLARRQGPQGLAAFLAMVAASAGADPHHRGCFMVNTAAAGTKMPEVDAHMARFRDGFAATLAADPQAGGPAIQAQADAAVAVMAGLLVLARLGLPRGRLEAAARALSFDEH